MPAPDPVQSEKILKGMLAALGVLLLLSNLMWFIAYNTVSSPLAKPTITPTPSVTVTVTVSPSPTPTASASPYNPGASTATPTPMP